MRSNRTRMLIAGAAAIVVGLCGIWNASKLANLVE